MAEGASVSGRTRTEAACASRSVQPGKSTEILHFKKEREMCVKNQSQNLKTKVVILIETINYVSNTLPFKDLSHQAKANAKSLMLLDVNSKFNFV